MLSNAGGEGLASEFPAPLFTTDPYSENLRLKQAILQQTGGRPQVAVTDADVSYLKRLEAQQQRAKFNQFLANIFKYSDPAHRDKFLGLFPEYAEIRKKLVNNRAELETRLASIMITGIQSKDDVMLVYGLNMGHMQLPDAPLYDPKGYYRTAGDYTAGPFAPKFANKQANAIRKLNESLGLAYLNEVNDNRGDLIPLPEAGLGRGPDNKPSDAEQQLINWAGYRNA